MVSTLPVTSTTAASDSYDTIANVASVVGRNRRTLERWISAGKLVARASETDRRVRLVSLQDATALANRSLRRPPAVEPSSAVTAMRTLPAEQNTIDEALKVLYAYHHRLISRVFPDAERPLHLDELRAGPLGQDLVVLDALARGARHESKAQVITRIDKLLQLLFWPPLADDYQVPYSFWDTPLGRLLAMAKFNAYTRAELLTVRAATRYLGVAKSTIYRWMHERRLGYVLDALSGRVFLVASDVAALRAAATAPVSEPAPAAGGSLGDAADHAP